MLLPLLHSCFQIDLLLEFRHARLSKYISRYQSIVLKGLFNRFDSLNKFSVECAQRLKVKTYNQNLIPIGNVLIRQVIILRVLIILIECVYRRRHVRLAKSILKKLKILKFHLRLKLFLTMRISVSTCRRRSTLSRKRIRSKFDLLVHIIFSCGFQNDQPVWGPWFQDKSKIRMVDSQCAAGRLTRSLSQDRHHRKNL